MLKEKRNAYLLKLACLVGFFGHTVWHAGSQFPDQASNPHLLLGKHGVLITGPQEKSQQVPVLGRMVREVLAYMSTFEQGFEEMKGETM